MSQKSGEQSKNGSQQSVPNSQRSGLKQQNQSKSQIQEEGDQKNMNEYQRILSENLQLKGLEITSDLTCNREGHENERIIFICKHAYCDAPRRLACAFCMPDHANHMKQCTKLTEFRQETVDARTSIIKGLVNFSSEEKRSLIDEDIVVLIKDRQNELRRTFEQFLQFQRDQLLKLIDGHTENYLFEETQAILKTGKFYDNCDHIFQNN